MIRLIFVFFLCLPVGFSETSSEFLQKKLDIIKTMKANFIQTVATKKQGVSNASGIMALSRPNHFRWQTNKPMPQLLIADGEKLWIYDEELEQVSVKKQSKNIGGVAAMFLSEKNNLVGRDFNVSWVKKGNKHYFDLQAKNRQASFERVQLFFDGDILKGIDLYDQLGQHTKVTLKKVTINGHLPPDLFKFTVPEGTDVVS